MNRLIIIGNGFDLAHGLKTRYSDFMLDYLKGSIIMSASAKQNDLLIEIIGDKECISNYEHQIIKQTSINDILNLLQGLGFKIKFQNSFIESLINEALEKNWVDIENLYYQHLLVLLKDYTLNKRGEVQALNNLKSLNNQMTFLKEKLVEYLKKVDADFNFASILDSDFHYELESVFTENVRTYDKQARGTRIGSVIVLNFNYTNLIQKYCKRLKDQFYIEHIQLHGKLADPNSIVFGYGDEIHASYKEIEHLNENEFFEHIKSFKYFQNSDYQKLMSFIGADPFEV